MENIGLKIKLQVIPKDINNCIGIIIYNFPPNFMIDFEKINLALINASKNYNITKNYNVSSGLIDNVTTNNPIKIIYKLENIIKHKPEIIRPNTKDLAMAIKTHLKYDTVYPNEIFYLFIIFGTICREYLKTKNIDVFSHIYRLKDIHDLSLGDLEIDTIKQNIMELDSFPIIDPRAKSLMKQLIKKTEAIKDTIGGTIETVIKNLPIGIGNIPFQKLNSQFSFLLFQIPNCFSVEFGSINNLSNKFGSKIVDEIYYQNDMIKLKSNNLGGLNDGLSNGNDILIKSSFYPDLPINCEVKTINIATGEEITISSLSKNEVLKINFQLQLVQAFISYCILDNLLYK